LSYDRQHLFADLARLMRSPIARPFLGIALVLGASRTLLAAANTSCRRCRWSAETARKSLHVGMGTLLLACPWVFDQNWPVVVLAGVYVALLLARQILPPLRYHVAGVIYGVPRQSRGEYYFPVIVAALFTLSRGDVLCYCVALGLLVYADAAAAIVGTRYGLTRFTVGQGCKSLEGCAAFAATAFVVAHVPLLLSGRVSAAASLLISANLAIATTAIEAACWRGFDNLAVPLLGFVVLRALLQMQVRWLAVCLVGGAALLAFTLLAMRAVRLNGGAGVLSSDA
jgi:phytol kinase